jgi:hypothetical protein
MSKNCRFRKKNGDACGADAQLGKDLCVFHDPARSAEGQKARRAGGLKRTRAATVLNPDTPDHPLVTTKDVANLLGDSINQLRRGQLDPRVANGIGYLTSVLLRALEQGPMEERLAQLEAILGKSGNGSEMFKFQSTSEVTPRGQTPATEDH